MDPQEEKREEEPAEPAEPATIPSDPPPQPGEDKVSIDLTDADDDDTAPREEPKVRHKSEWRKMRDSFREQMEARDRTERELRERLARLEGRVTAPPPRQEAAAAANPLEAEISTTWKQQQRLLATIRAGGHSEAEVREMEDEWRQLDRKRRGLEAKADNSRREEPEGAGDADFNFRLLKAQFPKAMGKQGLRLEAEAVFEQLKDQGRPHSIETAQEACRRVASRHGLGKPPAPSNGERARHSGVSGRPGATGNGSGDKYTPSKYIMNLARSYTSHLPDLSDEDRYKHWRRYVGKKEGLVP